MLTCVKRQAVKLKNPTFVTELFTDQSKYPLVKSNNYTKVNVLSTALLLRRKLNV